MEVDGFAAMSLGNELMNSVLFGPRHVIWVCGLTGAAGFSPTF